MALAVPGVRLPAWERGQHSSLVHARGPFCHQRGAAGGGAPSHDVTCQPDECETPTKHSWKVWLGTPPLCLRPWDAFAGGNSPVPRGQAVLMLSSPLARSTSARVRLQGLLRMFPNSRGGAAGLHTPCKVLRAC